MFLFHSTDLQINLLSENAKPLTDPAKPGRPPAYNRKLCRRWCRKTRRFLNNVNMKECLRHFRFFSERNIIFATEKETT